LLIAAAATLEIGVGASLLRFWDSDCCLKCVYKISSKKDDKWSKCSIQRFFQKAAAVAILENGVCVF
jgi:hypothetical protein